MKVDACGYSLSIQKFEILRNQERKLPIINYRLVLDVTDKYRIRMNADMLNQIGLPT